jgi:hypothetical protein
MIEAGVGPALAGIIEAPRGDGVDDLGVIDPSR